MQKDLKMSDAAYLDQAVEWSREMTRMKSRGPGDTPNAMRQIEREYGIDYGFIWALRYRRKQLKIISHSIYLRIEAAYYAECERQRRKLDDELYETGKIAGSDNVVVRTVGALVSTKME